MGGNVSLQAAAGFQLFSSILHGDPVRAAAGSPTQGDAVWGGGGGGGAREEDNTSAHDPTTQENARHG